MPIVRIQNLSKVFGPSPRKALPLIKERKSRQEIQEKAGQTVGVGDINFDVHKGEILVVMGLSGSGKSTLVRCINRLIEPTVGKIEIDGQDILQMNKKQLRDVRRHKIAMVFQNFGLFPHRTVQDNAEYGLEVMGESKAVRFEKARNALELVGLKGWEDRLPRQLSGGMQQRVGLARALAVNPQIILMDEALSALDPLIRKDMQNELIDLQRKLKTTIIFITHDLDEAINMGDRIVLMKDGYVAQKGTAEEILTDPASDYVARFVEEVDMSKVLTAGSIMKKVHDVAHESDGPRVMLHKMRDLGVSTMFVVDSHRKLCGIARAETVAQLVDKTDEEKAHRVDRHVKTVHENDPVQSVIPLMAENREPVAVLDDDDKLKGVIVVGTLLAGMSEGVQ